VLVLILVPVIRCEGELRSSVGVKASWGALCWYWC